jgi:hypothetical protein
MVVCHQHVFGVYAHTSLLTRQLARSCTAQVVLMTTAGHKTAVSAADTTASTAACSARSTLCSKREQQAPTEQFIAQLNSAVRLEACAGEWTAFANRCVAGSLIHAGTLPA